MTSSGLYRENKLNKLKSSIHLNYCRVYKKSTLISLLVHETKIWVIIIRIIIIIIVIIIFLAGGINF